MTKIICKECGKQLKKVSTIHLQSKYCTGKCKTVTDYKEKYPGAPIVCEESRNKVSATLSKQYNNKPPEFWAPMLEKRRATYAKKTPEQIRQRSKNISEAVKKGQAKRTPEQRAITNKQTSETMKKSRANETKEQKESRSNKVKENWAKRTPYENSIIGKKISNTLKIVLAKKTAKQKKVATDKMNITKSKWSPERKKEVHRHRSKSSKKAYANLTLEQKLARGKKITIGRRKFFENLAPEERKVRRINRSEKRKLTMENWSPERKLLNRKKHSLSAINHYNNITPQQTLAAVTKWKASMAKKTPEQMIAIREKRAVTMKKHGQGTIFMGEWFRSSPESEVAKLLFDKLGIVPFWGINREVMINGKMSDFYPQVLGCFIEYHPMNHIFEPRTDRNLYYQDRRELLDSNGYEETELIHYTSIKEAREKIDYISDLLDGFTSKDMIQR